MPLDEITITSTTDPQADVNAALGLAAPVVVPEAVVPPSADVSVATATSIPAEVAEDDATTPIDAAGAPLVEAAPVVDAAAPPVEKAKRLTAAVRIGQVVKERETAVANATAAQIENEALRRRVADLVGAAGVPAPAAPVVAAPVAEPEPTPDQFDTYEAYSKALAGWVTKTTVADAVRLALQTERDAQAQWRAQSAEQAAVQVYTQGRESARARHTDYDTVVNQPDLNLTQTMRVTMLSAGEAGAEIAYYLGQHPDECRAIHALGDTPMAAVRLGKILAHVEPLVAPAAIAPAAVAPAVATPAAAVVAAPPVRVITKAPDPIVPVAASAPSPTTEMGELAFQDFKAQRIAQRKAAGRSLI